MHVLTICWCKKLAYFCLIPKAGRHPRKLITEYKFLPVFHVILYLKMCFRQFSRVLDQHFCVDQWLGISYKKAHFSSFFHQSLAETCDICENSRFRAAFGVRGSQTLVEIYNIHLRTDNKTACSLLLKLSLSQISVEVDCFWCKQINSWSVVNANQKIGSWPLGNLLK